VPKPRGWRSAWSERQTVAALDECRSSSPGSSFRELIGEIALRVGVEPRALAVRVLLQLPRIVSHNGWIARGQARRELTGTAERLRNDARAACAPHALEEFPPRDLIFEVIDPSRALPVLSSLHYLPELSVQLLVFCAGRPNRQASVTLSGLLPLQWTCVAVSFTVSSGFQGSEPGMSPGCIRSMSRRRMRFHSYCQRFENTCAATCFQLICSLRRWTLILVSLGAAIVLQIGGNDD
jgi:hypothetical protein